MADFITTYNKWIKPVEGGYSNVTSDLGGETYAGISRKAFPNWSGWPFIDAQPHPIPRYKIFPELNKPVEAFYKNLYTSNNFDKINNQNVADILFDWFVNSGSNAANTKGTETYGVDEILNRDFGYRLPLDAKFDSATINAINSVNSAKLHGIIKNERIKFYNVIIERNPSQKANEKGWLARIAAFPDIQAYITLGGMGLMILIVLVLFIVYL